MGLIGTLLGGYVLLVALVFVVQRSLLYLASGVMPDPASMGVPGLEAVTVESTDGLNLTHWYRPAAAPDGPVVVIFHGNAGHIGHRVGKFAGLFDAGFGVFLAEYRGYGGNPGRPSEAALTADARRVLDWLEERDVAARRIVLYGESLGSGIVVKLAAEGAFAGLILESAFSSMADVAQGHYWYLPARWLLLDQWDSMSRIAGVAAPMLFIHGERDSVVPYRYGLRLYQAAPEPKESLFLAAAGHNDLFNHREVTRAIIDFVRRKVPTAGTASD